MDAQDLAEERDHEYDLPLYPRVVNYGSFTWDEKLGRLVQTGDDDLDPESKALGAWEGE